MVFKILLELTDMLLLPAVVIMLGWYGLSRIQGKDYPPLTPENKQLCRDIEEAQLLFCHLSFTSLAPGKDFALLDAMLENNKELEARLDFDHANLLNQFGDVLAQSFEPEEGPAFNEIMIAGQSTPQLQDFERLTDVSAWYQTESLRIAEKFIDGLVQQAEAGNLSKDRLLNFAWDTLPRHTGTRNQNRWEKIFAKIEKVNTSS